MTRQGIRLKCLSLALSVPGTHKETDEERTDRFEAYAGDDPVKMACLELSVKHMGPLARISAQGMIEHATNYVAIVGRWDPEPGPARQRKPAKQAKTRGRYR